MMLASDETQESLQMSITPPTTLYSYCVQAIDLIASGDVRTLDYPFFTQIDVVELVRRLQEQDDPNAPLPLKRTMRVANDVLGARWRSRMLYRYGPVFPPGSDEPDYARIASKIVHTAMTDGAPEYMETPNGKFLRFLIEDDRMKRQGRRHSTRRNDLEPWGDQNIRVSKGSDPFDSEDNDSSELETIKRLLDWARGIERRVSRIEEIERTTPLV